MSNIGWSENRVATLSKLWLQGLSASQVAQQLGGVTRNAVIGKVHRLGLADRGLASAPTRAKGVSAHLILARSARSCRCARGRRRPAQRRRKRRSPKHRAS